MSDLARYSVAWIKNLACRQLTLAGRRGARNNLPMRMLLVGILLAGSATMLTAAKNLEVYAIDVEGGQATLVVSPSGESLLVDTGWGGHNKRDALRIMAAAKAAGVKKIDYLLITHYHSDHVGGIGQLAEKLPIRNFVDHGPTVETEKASSGMPPGGADR